MKLKGFICIFLCVILSLTFLNGCDSAEDYVIYFELDSAPDTLDPQLASDISEQLVVKNIFEGLVRKDADGKTVPAAAEKYSLSDDKCTYTFKISPNAKWSDGINVTADDFVFAFERALDPVTKSPYASALFSIKGAEEVVNGSKKALLGIKATDNTTLVITLNSPDPSFLNTLTMPISMPCRRDIFEKAKGKYGKTIDTVLGNGSFKLRFWEKDEKFSLRLNKNEEYSGNFAAETSAVIFNLGDINQRGAKIAADNLDMGFIHISEAGDGVNTQSFEKTSYALIINNDSVFGDEDFKKAFAMSIHRNRFKNDLPISLVQSECIIPNSIRKNGKSITNQVTIPQQPEYNPESAHEHYIKAAKKAKDVPSSIELIYYGNDEISNMVGILTENLQQSLGVVVNSKALESQSKLSEALSLKNYHLAIVPLTAQSDDPYEFLERFTSDSNNNIYGYSSKSFDREIAKILPSADDKTVSLALSSALKTLRDDGSVIPLANYTECFCYSKEFACPTISPFGGIIDLAFVRKVR